VGLAVASTEVEEDIDGGPPGGALSVSPAVATTKAKDINAGPLGDAASGSGSAYHCC
jgi:hypothetical protein